MLLNTITEHEPKTKDTDELMTKTSSCTRLSVVKHFTFFSAVYILNLFTILCPYFYWGSVSQGKWKFKLVRLLFPLSLTHCSLSPSYTSVQSPTRTSELLNTRKRGNSPKMEVLGDEPAMPDCFSPFVQVSFSPR